MSPRNDTRIDTNCSLPPETVREHSERLARIETKLDQVLDNMDVLFKKAQTNADNISANSHRLTVLETQKGTAIAIVTAIGSGLIAILGLLLSVFDKIQHK